MQTIKNDAKRYANSSTNTDKLRSRYFDADVNKELFVIFPAFEIFAFEYNLFKLMAESSKEKFKIEWTQRPDYTSYEFYKNPTYWSLILFTNQINSREDYRNLDVVLIPSMRTILDVIKYRVPATDIVNLQEVQKPNNSLRYYKSHPFDEKFINKNTVKDRVVIQDYSLEIVPIYELDGGTFI
jgi:hypothetical protein